MKATLYQKLLSASRPKVSTPAWDSAAAKYSGIIIVIILITYLINVYT